MLRQSTYGCLHDTFTGTLRWAMAVRCAKGVSKLTESAGDILLRSLALKVPSLFCQPNPVIATTTILPPPNDLRGVQSVLASPNVQVVVILTDHHVLGAISCVAALADAMF